MTSYNYKYCNEKNDNKNKNKEISTLKEILSPKVLEVIGKKYTDIYIRNLGKKYNVLIDNIINNKKLSSISNDGTKINSGEESKLNNIYDSNYKTNKNNFSTFWKDYNFVNNTMIDKKIKNVKENDNFNNSYFLNIVQISKNNCQSNEEERSESMVIKSKEEENEDEEI